MHQQVGSPSSFRPSLLLVPPLVMEKLDWTMFAAWYQSFKFACDSQRVKSLPTTAWIECLVIESLVVWPRRVLSWQTPAWAHCIESIPCSFVVSSSCWQNIYVRTLSRRTPCLSEPLLWGNPCQMWEGWMQLPEPSISHGGCSRCHAGSGPRPISR